MDTLVSGQIYLRPALDKNPFLLGSHINFAFTRSGEQPAPVTDAISASQGCPHTGASTVTPKIIIMSANFFLQ